MIHASKEMPPKREDFGESQSGEQNILGEKVQDTAVLGEKEQDFRKSSVDCNILGEKEQDAGITGVKDHQQDTSWTMIHAPKWEEFGESQSGEQHILGEKLQDTAVLGEKEQDFRKSSVDCNILGEKETDAGIIGEKDHQQDTSWTMTHASKRRCSLRRMPTKLDEFGEPQSGEQHILGEKEEDTAVLEEKEEDFRISSVDCNILGEKEQDADATGCRQVEGIKGAMVTPSQSSSSKKNKNMNNGL